MVKKSISYKDSGVDINAADKAIVQIKRLVKATYNKSVLNELGAFGGFFSGDFQGLKKPVMISSADGVGTKLKLAFMTGIHDTVGQDLVNHCTDDILVHGAKPLYFLDYFASGKLKPNVVVDVIKGISKACKKNNCALIGGEMAEMPDMYSKGEYDLAGFVVGVVDKKKIIDGSKIKVGDTLIGIKSNGLHTNGYSLVRKLFFERLKMKPSKKIPEFGSTLGEELLRVHKSYLIPIQKLIAKVKINGIAHITGGGIPGNLSRILPKGCLAKIEKGSWDNQAIFEYIKTAGNVKEAEMYHTFNMGIGMILVVGKKETDQALKLLKKERVTPRIIGEIVKGKTSVELV